MGLDYGISPDERSLRAKPILDAGAQESISGFPQLQGKRDRATDETTSAAEPHLFRVSHCIDFAGWNDPEHSTQGSDDELPALHLFKSGRHLGAQVTWAWNTGTSCQAGRTVLHSELDWLGLGHALTFLFSFKLPQCGRCQGSRATSTQSPELCLQRGDNLRVCGPRLVAPLSPSGESWSFCLMEQGGLCHALTKD